MCVSIHMHVCCVYVCVYTHICVQEVLRLVCPCGDPHWVSVSIACHLTFDHNSIKLFHGDFLHVSDMFLLLSQPSSALHPTIFSLPSLWVRPHFWNRHSHRASSVQFALLVGLTDSLPTSPCDLPTSAHGHLVTDVLGLPGFHVGTEGFRACRASYQALFPWRCPQPQHNFSVRWGLDSDLRDYPICFLFSAVFGSVNRKLKAIVQLYYINALLILPRNASPK